MKTSNVERIRIIIIELRFFGRKILLRVVQVTVFFFYYYFREYVAYLFTYTLGASLTIRRLPSENTFH